MGARGPIAQPDNVRRLRGMKPYEQTQPRTPAGDRVRRLVLAPKAPKPPSGLGRAGAAEWRRVVPELERAGVLSTIDRGVLAAYCQAWGRMQEASKVLDDEGLIRNTKDGAARHPAWLIYKDAQAMMVRAARECYLTPTARLRIPVPRGATEDDGSGDDLFD